MKRDTQYFQLERKPVMTFGTDTLMLCMVSEPVRDATHTPNFYLGDGGDVYFFDGTSGVKVGTGTCGGGDIVNATLFNILGQLYYILYVVNDYTNPTAGALWYINVNVAGITTGSWNGNTHLLSGIVTGLPAGFQPGDKYNHSYQFINDTNRVLYYVAGNQLNTIDVTGIYDNRMTTDFYITGLTRHNQLFRVYTHFSKIYFWDGFSKAFDGEITISYNIRYVRNQGDTDYVVLGTEAGKSMLGVFTGQDLTFINKAVKSKLVDVTDFIKFQYDINNVGSNYTMAQYGNIVYMSGDGLMGGGMGIMSYGSEYRGYPKGVFIESNQTAGGLSINQIGFIANPLNLGMTLQYSYKNSAGAYGIETIDLSAINTGGKFVNNGVLFSKRMDAIAVMGRTTTKMISSPRKQKRITELNVRADLPAGTQIDILYTINGGISYAPLTTIVPPVSGNRDGFRRRLYGVYVEVVYYDIAFKVILSTGNNTLSPKFYYLSFNSEEIKS